MKVHFFRRKFNFLFFSIEELFDTIQQNLNDIVAVENITVPKESSGIINRIHNVFHALRNKGEVNHITGDIHYLGIFLPRRNTILTIHDCGELEKQKGIKKLILWLFWFYIPVKRLKYITVISNSTKEHLLKYVNTKPDKIRVIPNCLIGNYFTDARRFNALKPTILQVGVTPNKNLERVAAALENIPCYLKIIGAPSVSQLQALARHKIDFQHVANLSREKIIEEYKSCDFVIFVSLLEGFGLPIIEAQASGKVVITSNINPMVSTAGEGACLVNPFVVAEIRNAVEKVINDEEYRKQVVSLGEQNYKRFSPTNIADQYLQLYREVYKESSFSINK